MRPIRLLPAAERDLARLQDFLITKSERAARAAGAAIRLALGSLGAFPEQGPQMYRGGGRRLVIKFGRDGYLAQYRVTENEVLVTRIFHTREHRGAAHLIPLRGERRPANRRGDQTNLRETTTRACWRPGRRAKKRSCA